MVEGGVVAACAGDVLVVDDEPDIRNVVAELLQAVGYRVRTAANGREAVAAIEYARPALILLDLTMPIMSGWEVVEWVKNYGLVSMDQILVMSAAGALCPSTLPLVAKPFDIQDLLAEIRLRTRSSV